MMKKMEILGIQLHNDTVEETMPLVEQYLKSTGMSTIGEISMRMLMRSQEDGVLRDVLANLDLAIPGQKELLRADGSDLHQRVREIAEHRFFLEFMNCMIQNGKVVYLLSDTRERVEGLEAYLRKQFENIRLGGIYAMEECVGDYDGAVNEINIASPDIVVSVIPTPEQEYFLAKNRSKMNVAIWYGIGDNYADLEGLAKIGHKFRQVIQKSMLHRMQSKYNQKNGNEDGTTDE